MAATFSGVPGDQIEPVERYDPKLGLTYFPRWKGSPASMLTVKAAIRTLGYGYSTSWDGAYEVVEADYPEDETLATNEPLSDEWDLDHNLAERDIWLLPVVQTEMDKITAQEKSPGVPGDRNEARRKFKADFEALLRGETKTTLPDGSETDLFFSDLMAIAALFSADTSVFESLYDDMCNGLRSYLVTEWVIRRNIITNKSSTLKATKTNCNRQFTTAAMLSTEPAGGVPADVKFEIPTGFWLKMVPKVNILSRGKWEIQQEYWFSERYSAISYGAPVA